MRRVRQSLARYVFEQCGPAEQPTCGTRAAPPTRSIGAPPSNGSPWTAYIPPDTEGLQELMESIPQLPDGSIDLNWFLTLPQGDRSAEGYMYNPTLGYHKDIGEAFWEGKALTYVKLKQATRSPTSSSPRPHPRPRPCTAALTSRQPTPKHQPSPSL